MRSLASIADLATVTGERWTVNQRLLVVGAQGWVAAYAGCWGASSGAASPRMASSSSAVACGSASKYRTESSCRGLVTTRSICTWRNQVQLPFRLTAWCGIT